MNINLVTLSQTTSVRPELYLLCCYLVLCKTYQSSTPYSLKTPSAWDSNKRSCLAFLVHCLEFMKTACFNKFKEVGLWAELGTQQFWKNLRQLNAAAPAQHLQRQWRSPWRHWKSKTVSEWQDLSLQGKLTQNLKPQTDKRRALRKWGCRFQGHVHRASFILRYQVGKLLERPRWVPGHSCFIPGLPP